MIVFFKDTAPTEISPACHTLSLPDALPISHRGDHHPDRPAGPQRARHRALPEGRQGGRRRDGGPVPPARRLPRRLELHAHPAPAPTTGLTLSLDRKSTRLNSSH